MPSVYYAQVYTPHVTYARLDNSGLFVFIRFNQSTNMDNHLLNITYPCSNEYKISQCSSPLHCIWRDAATMIIQADDFECINIGDTVTSNNNSQITSVCDHHEQCKYTSINITIQGPLSTLIPHIFCQHNVVLSRNMSFISNCSSSIDHGARKL